MTSLTAVIAGLAATAGVALAAPAQADEGPLYADRYIAGLTELGVQVDSGNVVKLFDYGHTVCNQFAMGVHGSGPFRWLQSLGFSRNDASAIVVVAVNVMCPEYEYKLHF